MRAMESLIRELTHTFICKDKDYGSSVTDTHKKFGIVALDVRIADKINRFKKLSTGAAPMVAEKLDDTVKDMLNYMAMRDCLYYATGDGYDTISLMQFVKELAQNLECIEASLNRFQNYVGKEILDNNTKGDLEKAIGLLIESNI